MLTAGDRALDAIISKIKNYKDVGFKTYSKLYSSGEVPVTDSCSATIRYYMTVHRCAPVLALTGDMGLISTQHRRLANMFKLWIRLVILGNDRLTRKLFIYVYNTTGKIWFSEI